MDDCYEFRQFIFRRSIIPALFSRFPIYSLDTHRYNDHEVKGEWLLRVSIFLMKYIFREEFPVKLKEIFQLLQEKEKEPGIREILEIVVNYITNATDRVSSDDLVIEIDNRFHEIGANIMPTIAEQFIQKGRLEGNKKESRKPL